MNYSIENIFLDMINDYGRILSIKEINKKYTGLGRCISRNKGKIYWEIKCYLKMLNKNIKIPNTELKKLNRYIIKNNSSSGSKLNKETLKLINLNKDILSEVINFGNNNY